MGGGVIWRILTRPDPVSGQDKEKGRVFVTGTRPRLRLPRKQQKNSPYLVRDRGTKPHSDTLKDKVHLEGWSIPWWSEEDLVI